MDRYKIIDDAAVVTDACGAVLSVEMIDGVLIALRLKGFVGHDPRVVAPPPQTDAYLMGGYAFTLTGSQKVMHNGIVWKDDTRLPADCLLVEVEGAHGCIKNLAVKE